MGYHIREGVILRQVCGDWLIIAVGEAAKHCLYVREINDTLAWYWQWIEEGLGRDGIIRAAREQFDAPEELILKDVDKLIKDLVRMGYLLEPPADGPAEENV